MQPAQHRSGEHERTCRQAMSGFRLRHSRRIPRRVRHARTQCAMRESPRATLGQPLERFNTDLFDGNFIGFLRQTQIEMIEFSPSHADSKMVGGTSFHGCGRARRIRQSNDFGWCERT